VWIPAAAGAHIDAVRRQQHLTPSPEGAVDAGNGHASANAPDTAAVRKARGTFFTRLQSRCFARTWTDV